MSFTLLRAIGKALTQASDEVIVELKKVPVKFRWAVSCIIFSVGFFLAVVQSGTYFADKTHTVGLSIAVGIVLMGIGLDIFIYANNEEKAIESEDRKNIEVTGSGSTGA